MLPTDDVTLKNKDVQRQEENYYQVLGCSEKASLEELKHSYQELIKKFHPDKSTSKSATSDKFVLIDKAYKLLRDERLRREYDASLLGNCINENSLIYDELSKKELDFNKEGVAYYPCRCGDNVVIEKEYLNETDCIVECSECTNCILIR